MEFLSLEIFVDLQSNTSSCEYKTVTWKKGRLTYTEFSSLPVLYSKAFSQLENLQYFAEGSTFIVKKELLPVGVFVTLFKYVNCCQLYGVCLRMRNNV